MRVQYSHIHAHTALKRKSSTFERWLHGWSQVPGDALESSLAIENELDARFLLLCTPQLEQARHALQACALLFLFLAPATWHLLPERSNVAKSVIFHVLRIDRAHNKKHSFRSCCGLKTAEGTNLSTAALRSRARLILP